MKIFRYLAFSVFLAISVSGANAQDFDKGLAAYNAGDYQTALSEWIILADGGNADAQYNIGQMYRNGLGVIQGYTEAAIWYRLAANQGLVLAQHNLGMMYVNGEGVIQNVVIAHMWFNIASANGYDVAAYMRDFIAAETMTREEIEKAQAMAQECISSGYKDCGD